MSGLSNADSQHDLVVDTVVIGGSAGAFDALGELLGALPTTLGASVLVALHRSEHQIDTLAALFGRRSALPCHNGRDGMPLTPGEVVFAPADRHLLLGEAHLHLRRGPTENGFRPAIDPLFRSAAAYRPTRSVGVILSGRLDDGASGLRALARAGGRCLVQSPHAALAPDMPHAALRAVPDALVLEPRALAEAIAEAVGRPAAVPGAVPEDIALDLAVAAVERSTIGSARRFGELAPYNCPACNGALWRIEDGAVARFRCHTGHAYTELALSVEQRQRLEEKLYDNLRAQRGHADLLRRMATRSDSPDDRQRFERRAARAEEDACSIAALLQRAPEEPFQGEPAETPD